jgi:hypothetical protein
MLGVSRLAILGCRSIMDPKWKARIDGMMVVVLVSGAQIEDRWSGMATDQP